MNGDEYSPPTPEQAVIRPDPGQYSRLSLKVLINGGRAVSGVVFVAFSGLPATNLRRAWRGHS